MTVVRTGVPDSDRYARRADILVAAAGVLFQNGVGAAEQLSG